jgi:hypothetical protein
MMLQQMLASTFRHQSVLEKTSVSLYSSNMSVKGCICVLSFLLGLNLSEGHAQSPYTYTTNADNTLTITGYTGPGGAVTIPTKIFGRVVTVIGDYAFSWFLGNTRPTSLTIPDNVTCIGNYLYQDDTYSLTNVMIGSGVTNIGSEAFYECLNLAGITVNISNSFYSSLSGILFDKNQTTIVHYPNGAGGTYTVPAGVTSIGDNAFERCFLTNINIPDNVTNIGAGAFDYCPGLTGFTLPSQLVTIGSGAFSGCSGITSITVPNGVSVIGDGAFESCGLYCITIPDSVTNVGGYVFDGCTSLTSVAIGNGVTSIGDASFYLCSSLSNIVIPDSVTDIGDYAFHLCTSLSNISIGNGVTSIGDYAFQYCFNLSSIAIGSSVTSIGVDAFVSDSGLASVKIPGSVTNIGVEAFLDCGGLTTIIVDPANAFYSSVNGVLFDKGQKTLVSYPGGIVGGYAIPEGVTSIAVEAFSGGSVTSVVIPTSITNIPTEAFSSCGYLTNVVIPDSVTIISDHAFWSCSGLTKVSIPNSVATIGTSAFQFCNGLTNVVIGSSVTNIGSWAFFNCPNLGLVYFEGNAPIADPTVFEYDYTTAFYLAGTIGWDAFSANTGVPARLWNPSIQVSDPSFGVLSNQFGFNITGTSNIIFVVETCSDLSNPVWSPLQTIYLTNNLLHFTDPQRTDHPSRYYRIRSP